MKISIIISSLTSRGHFPSFKFEYSIYKSWLQRVWSGRIHSLMFSKAPPTYCCSYRFVHDLTGMNFSFITSQAELCLCASSVVYDRHLICFQTDTILNFQDFNLHINTYKYKNIQNLGEHVNRNEIFVGQSLVYL